MDDLLLNWIWFDHTFYEQTDIVCPSCGACELILDTLDDVYRCQHCENSFTLPDDAD